MIFREAGNEGSPAVLLIHGMLCTAEDSLSYGKYLAEDHFVICPTLDGHGEDKYDLISAHDEAVKIVAYLKEKDINSVSLLQGCSMGAEVALSVLKECERNGITVEKAFFDGGPFFDFHPLFRKFMEAVFTSLISRIEESHDSEVIVSHPFVRFVGGKKADAFRPLMEKVAEGKQHYTQSSVKGMVETCYHCQLPMLDRETQKRCMFFFSREEPARKSRKRLKKAYPDALYTSINGHPHCGLMINKPESYSKMLRSYMMLDCSK